MRTKRLATILSSVLLSLTVQLLLAPTSQADTTVLGTTGNFPMGIALDSAGNVYTANHDDNTVTKISPAGVSTILGTTGSNPIGIAVDSAGNVYTTNSGSNNVTKITPDGTSSIYGTTGRYPWGLAFDSVGNLFVANSDGNSITKITPNGNSSIFATGITGPRGIYIDSSDNIVTVEYGGSKLWKITPGGIATRLTSAFNLLFAQAVVEDHQGNIFVAANGGSKISKVTPTGGVSTFASLSGPTAMVIDSFDNLFVASAQRIYEYSPSGNRTLLGYAGSSNQYFIALDALGNVYNPNLGLNTVTKTSPPPPNFSLSTSGETATVGAPIASYTLTSNGGTIYQYSISPTVGNGLSFNSVTGQLAGVPTGPSSPVTYTITGINGGGSASASYTIAINPTAPNFTLSQSSETATVGTAISGYTIVSTGGVIDSFSISPGIANGLSFNSTTGLISGMPISEAGPIMYTITATNVTGSTSQNYNLKVGPASPLFNLSNSGETVTVGSVIRGYTISSSGGAVDNFSITPSIGNGLSFSTLTGLISGTPTSVAASVTYTITGTNSTNSVSHTYTINVIAIPAAPSPPIPVPDPIQQSKITSISPISITSNSPSLITLSGNFVEKISAIQVDGVGLAPGSWKQTTDTVSFRVLPRSAGNCSIQLYNGSAPVMNALTLSVVEPPKSVVELAPAYTPKPKVIYLQCVKPGHGTRIAYGINPACPGGYQKK
jgi:Putative Ig domain